MICTSYMAGTQLILCSFIHSAWCLGGGDERILEVILGDGWYFF